MPGGCVELGEDLDAALRREIAEETGCVVHAEALIGVHTKLTDGEMVLLHFRCRHEAGEPRPNAETPEVGWFGEGDARRLVEREPHRSRLSDALAAADSIVYRGYRMHPYAVLVERTLRVAR